MYFVRFYWLKEKQNTALAETVERDCTVSESLSEWYKRGWKTQIVGWLMPSVVSRSHLLFLFRGWGSRCRVLALRHAPRHRPCFLPVPARPGLLQCYTPLRPRGHGGVCPGEYEGVGCSIGGLFGVRASNFCSMCRCLWWRWWVLWLWFNCWRPVYCVWSTMPGDDPLSHTHLWK